ncbi:MAG: hypothetical protein M3440_09690 [Chloroflexota bacterium]|nr:hypothetical protein [Chloroflexota bacterium]
MLRYEAPDNGGDTVAVYSALPRFRAQLPDPFPVRFTPGFHQLRLALIDGDDRYSFRSMLFSIFDCADDTAQPERMSSSRTLFDRRLAHQV